MQIAELKPVAAGVWEGDIVAAGAAEFAVEGEGIAHVYDQDEGRTAVLDLVAGQTAGVGLGLLMRLFHGRIPAFSAAHSGALFALFHPPQGRFRKNGLAGFMLVAALFGFQYKAASFIEIDETCRAMGGWNALFKDVVVFMRVFGSRLGMVHADDVAEFGEKELVVGAFGRAGGGPTVDKGLNMGWGYYFPSFPILYSTSVAG